MPLTGIEYASKYVALDDTAFADGNPLSAHMLREMARAANHLNRKGEFLFRWLGSSFEYDLVNWGQISHGVMNPGVEWTPLLPITRVWVPKPPGCTALRMRIRAQITAGKTLEFFVANQYAPVPEDANIRSSERIVGSGSTGVYQFSDLPAKEEAGDELSFFVRTLIDPSSDTALNTGTYGGAASGTATMISATEFKDENLVSGWNIGTNNVADAGHYVVFTHPTTGAQIQVARITEMGLGNFSATDSLHFFPPATGIFAHRRTGGGVFAKAVGGQRFKTVNYCDYAIYQLPKLSLKSIAVYAKPRGT